MGCNVWSSADLCSIFACDGGDERSRTGSRCTMKFNPRPGISNFSSKGSIKLSHLRSAAHAANFAARREAKPGQVCVFPKMQRCALSGAVFAVAFAAFHHYTHVLNPITRHLPAPSVNWDRTVSLASSSHTVIRPKFLYEVQKLVRDAAASGQKVKVVGAGHSWSTIAA